MEEEQKQKLIENKPLLIEQDKTSFIETSASFKIN